MAIDLSTSGTSIYQLALAVAVLVTMLAVAAGVALRLRYAGLSDAERDHKQRISEQLSQQAPATLYLDRETLHDDPDQARRLLREALTDGGSRIETVTVRDSLQSAGRDLRAGLEPVLGPIPGLALWLGKLALLAAVFGLVGVSTAAVRQALLGGPAGGGGAGIGGIVGAIPGADLVVALVLAVAVAGGGALVEHWLGVTAVLVGAALAVVVLDRRAGVDLDADGSRVATAFRWLGRLSLPLIGIWAVLSLVSAPSILAAWWRAPLLTQVVAVGLVVVGVGATAGLLASRTPEAYRALLAGLSRQRARVAALRSGFPILSVICVYTVLASFLAIPVALAVAVAVGLVARAAALGAIRLYRRGALREGAGRAPQQAVVDCYRVTDGDGAVHLIARFGHGDTISWPADPPGDLDPGREAVVETALRIAQARTAPDGRGETPATVAGAVADALLRWGQTDPREPIARLDERCREVIAAERPVTDVGALADRLREEVPKRVVERHVHRRRVRGDLREQRGHYEVTRRRAD